MSGAFAGAAEGERIFVTDHTCDRTDRELRVSQELFCFCDAKFADILMHGNANLLFEKLAEIIFGKADLAADRVNAELKAAVVGYAKARPVFEGYKADIAAYRSALLSLYGAIVREKCDFNAVLCYDYKINKSALSYIK